MVSVQGGICLGVKCPGGYLSGGKCLGGTCPGGGGGGGLSCHHTGYNLME